MISLLCRLIFFEAVHFLCVTSKVPAYLFEIVESIKRKPKSTLILFSRSISTTKSYILKAAKQLVQPRNTKCSVLICSVPSNNILVV